MVQTESADAVCSFALQNLCIQHIEIKTETINVNNINSLHHNNLNVVNSLDQMTNISYYFTLSQYQNVCCYRLVIDCDFVICRIV
jgi:hypothetical protein